MYDRLTRSALETSRISRQKFCTLFTLNSCQLLLMTRYQQKLRHIVRFEVIVAVTMNMNVFWNMTWCNVEPAACSFRVADRRRLQVLEKRRSALTRIQNLLLLRRYSPFWTFVPPKRYSSNSDGLCPSFSDCVWVVFNLVSLSFPRIPSFPSFSLEDVTKFLSLFSFVFFQHDHIFLVWKILWI